MKKLLLILLCLPLIGLGQEWTYNFSNVTSDAGMSIDKTTDGGYIICGASMEHYANGSFTRCPLLIKINNNGNVQWKKQFLDTLSIYNFEDVGVSSQQTSNGGYILLGLSGKLIKVNVNGDIEWTKFLNKDCHAIEQTSNGGYIVAGEDLDKIDYNGNIQWSISLNTLSYTRCYDIKTTNDGGYIITGRTGSTSTGTADIRISKIDTNGNETWGHTIDKGNNDVGYVAQQTSDGGYIVCGTKLSPSSSPLNTPWDMDIILIKYNANGVLQWERTLGDNTSDEGGGDWFGSDIQQTLDNGYIICTRIDNNILLIKTDINGYEEWVQTYGTQDDDYFHSIQLLTNGGYIICGVTTLIDENPFTSTFAQVRVIKTNSLGNISSEFSIPINPNREIDKVVDILGRDINPEKNKPFIEIYNDGTVEKKIIVE